MTFTKAQGRENSPLHNLEWLFPSEGYMNAAVEFQLGPKILQVT